MMIIIIVILRSILISILRKSGVPKLPENGPILLCISSVDPSLGARCLEIPVSAVVIDSTDIVLKTVLRIHVVLEIGRISE